MELKRVFSCGTSWKSGGISYFDLFIYNNIAILGSGNHNIESFRKLQPGDLVAAKSGHYLLAIAEIISDEAEYWLWKDYITNDEIDKYQVPPEADIDIVYVKKWFKFEEPIYYPTRSGTGFVQNDKKEIYQNKDGYEKDDIKQLSSYSRIKKVVEHFKNDKEYSNNDNYIPNCLIIYPSNNPNNINIDFEKKEEINDFINFYKLGIYIPRFD